MPKLEKRFTLGVPKLEGLCRGLVGVRLKPYGGLVHGWYRFTTGMLPVCYRLDTSMVPVCHRYATGVVPM